MKRKIKVAHTISRIVYGGAEENTIHTLMGLDKQRYFLDLIVGNEINEDMMGWDKNSRDFNVIQIKELLGPLNFFYDPIVFLKLLGIFKKNKYDIVHTHTTKTGILGRIAAKYAGVPVIICGLHGSVFQSFNSGILNKALIYFEKYAGKSTDAYISVSEILSDTYKKEGIGKDSKYFTVLSGMDTSKFNDIKNRVNIINIKKEFGISPDAFVIGNVARLEKVKGHKYLFDAFKIIKEKKKDIKIILIILGEGQEKDNFKEYIRKIGLNNDVIFTGYRKDIERVMAIMDIFVLSSLREGLPRVLVQAAASKIPSIAFNIDGVPEIVKDNYNGFLVEPKNVNGLVEGISKYIDNRELIKLHGENGEKLIQGKWTIESMVNQINDIYQTLIIEKKLNKKD